MGIRNIDILKPPGEQHVNCVHYQLNDGRPIEVEKGEPYEYCTDDPDR